MDIAKWEGPTVCESSTASAESNSDFKPKQLTVKKTLKKDLIKDERKRDATVLIGDSSIKEEAVSVKRERDQSPVGSSKEK